MSGISTYLHFLKTKGSGRKEVLQSQQGERHRHMEKHICVFFSKEENRSGEQNVGNADISEKKDPQEFGWKLCRF